MSEVESGVPYHVAVYRLEQAEKQIADLVESIKDMNAAHVKAVQDLSAKITELKVDAEKRETRRLSINIGYLFTLATALFGWVMTYLGGNFK